MRLMEIRKQALRGDDRETAGVRSSTASRRRTSPMSSQGGTTARSLDTVAQEQDWIQEMQEEAPTNDPKEALEEIIPKREQEYPTGVGSAVYDGTRETAIPRDEGLGGEAPLRSAPRGYRRCVVRGHGCPSQQSAHRVGAQRTWGPEIPSPVFLSGLMPRRRGRRGDRCRSSTVTSEGAAGTDRASPGGSSNRVRRKDLIRVCKVASKGGVEPQIMEVFGYE